MPCVSIAANCLLSMAFAMVPAAPQDVSSNLPTARAVSAPVLPQPVLRAPMALPSGIDFEMAMLRWSASAPSALTSTAPVSNAEQLEWPVRTGRLSSRFGIRNDPLGDGMRAHWGIDIPQAIGTPIHAAGRGVVTFAGWSSGYGNLVRIDHGDGYETRYGHLLTITVVRGTALQQGAIIGNVGSTGRSTGAHLHFEVRENGKPVDPLGRQSSPSSSIFVPPAPLPPAEEHWNGFGEDRNALPQSRLH